MNSIKQAFLLNVINFMQLYQLAVLMYSNPEAVHSLQSYNMWQSFLDNTTLHLHGSKVELYYLIYSVLRFHLPPPSDMTQFPLRHKMAAKSDNFRDLVVMKPHPLLAFGLYHPFKGLPGLARYTGKGLAN